MRNAVRKEEGFTLVEMLVALAIFAIIATAGVSVLTFTLRGDEPVEAAKTRLDQLQIAHSVMRDDFGQLAARPVRGEFGERLPGGLQGGVIPGSDAILSFVRRGWENPGGVEPRSSLQFVAYYLDNKALKRVSRPMLDPTPETPEESVTVLDGVERLHVTFFSNGQWLERWLATPDGNAMPTVIAVEAEIDGFGPVRQLFLTPVAQ